MNLGLDGYFAAIVVARAALVLVLMQRVQVLTLWPSTILYCKFGSKRLMEARIDMLPEAFRTVFMLRAVEEMSVEEVSAALGIPEATVRTRFFRARGLLREGLSRDVDLAIGDAFSFDGARCDRIVAGVLARWREQG